MFNIFKKECKHDIRNVEIPTISNLGRWSLLCILEKDDRCGKRIKAWYDGVRVDRLMSGLPECRLNLELRIDNWLGTTISPGYETEIVGILPEEIVRNKIIKQFLMKSPTRIFETDSGMFRIVSINESETKVEKCSNVYPPTNHTLFVNGNTNNPISLANLLNSLDDRKSIAYLNGMVKYLKTPVMTFPEVEMDLGKY